MAGWHHQCNGHELGQAPGDSEGQRGLVCSSPWAHKQSDMTEQLNNDKGSGTSMDLPLHRTGQWCLVMLSRLQSPWGRSPVLFFFSRRRNHTHPQLCLRERKHSFMPWPWIIKNGRGVSYPVAPGQLELVIIFPKGPSGQGQHIDFFLIHPSHCQNSRRPGLPS